MTQHVVHVTGNALTFTLSGQLAYRDRSTQRQRRHDCRWDSVPGNCPEKPPGEVESERLEASQADHAASDQHDATYVTTGHPGGKRQRHHEENPTHGVEGCGHPSDE